MLSSGMVCFRQRGEARECLTACRCVQLFRGTMQQHSHGRVGELECVCDDFVRMTEARLSQHLVLARTQVATPRARWRGTLDSDHEAPAIGFELVEHRPTRTNQRLPAACSAHAALLARARRIECKHRAAQIVSSVDDAFVSLRMQRPIARRDNCRCYTAKIQRFVQAVLIARVTSGRQYSIHPVHWPLARPSRQNCEDSRWLSRTSAPRWSWLDGREHQRHDRVAGHGHVRQSSFGSRK